MTTASRTLGATHTPLRQAVTDAIRDRIVDGAYSPGERLYEEALAAELGVSRNPIREALQVLAGEGFVEIEPRHGARVAAIDERRADEIFEVRAALEGLVAELAARKRTPEALTALRDTVEEGRRAAAEEELAALPKLNTRFHQQLAEMADNGLLTGMLDQLAGIIRWIYAERLEQRVRDSWHEHARITEAIEAADADTARRLAIEHVESAWRAFVGVRTPTS
jgi:DNA-binding GntR family transcriptional regulator